MANTDPPPASSAALPPTGPPPAGQYARYGRPLYGQPPYGQPPYGQPPYGQPLYGQPYPHRRTNTMAIIALVAAFVFAPVAIVLGVLARKEIRRTGKDGWMLATVGMWLGIVFTTLYLLMIPSMIAWMVYWMRMGPDPVIIQG